MKDITNISPHTGHENVAISHKTSNKLLHSKDLNDSRFTLTVKSKEDSIIKEEENEEKNNITENLSYKEKQLSILLDVFITSYSKKTYQDLIKDIEEKEDLLYKNSLTSFEIKIIKIKSLLKILLEEYNEYLKTKNGSFHDIDTLVLKIMKEFKILSILAINNNSYVYEITTQTYCKFLYILSKISRKREDYLKSLGFISLGINMLKVYLIKKEVFTDINSYKIYCKFLLELINILIGDNNYDQALLYVRLLFKIIEISLKFIYHHNNTNKKKLPIKTIKKFITFGGTTCIYIACCLEQLDDQIQAFEAYKQARFFLKKGSRIGLSFTNLNSITINNSCSFLADEVFEKLKIKFQNDKIEHLNRQKKLELQKKKEEYELLQNEKLMKLKYISNGMIGDPFKFEKLENKLNQKIFTSSVVNDLEKIDDELMSFVITYFNKNKKNNISLYKDKISPNVKKLMSRYEVYNILMSKSFREFIMKTKNLKFYNPKEGSKSISIIQRHLNNKIQMDLNTKKRNSAKKMSLYLGNTETFESSNTNRTDRKMRKFESPITITTSPNSKREDDKVIEKLLFKQNKNKKFRNNHLKYLLSQESYKTDKNIQKKICPSLNITTNKSMNHTRFKYKIKKKFNELACDFDKKHLDKNLMTKKYIEKYSYYDKLSSKELKFQKQILYFKRNNSLYNRNKSIEENNGIITKDDIIRLSLIINDFVKEGPNREEKIRKIKELNLLKESFSSKENKMTMKMKSAMSRVINKYILERRKFQSKQNNVDLGEIRKINEKKLSQINSYIKNINNNISKIQILAGKK